VPSEVKDETRFDVRFVQKICNALIKQYKVEFLAFDFVVSYSDGAYVLVDVNYFPPY